MIKTEYPYNGDETRIRTYSDEGFKIQPENTNKGPYDEAIDLYPCIYTYTETEEKVEIIEAEVVEIIEEIEENS